jgi:hypothetical protein
MLDILEFNRNGYLTEAMSYNVATSVDIISVGGNDNV